MIYLTVLIQVSKEQEQSFLETAKGLIEHSRQEVGCEAYFLTKVNNDQYNYVLNEVWTSEEALEAHRQTEHYKVGVPQLAAMTEILLPMAGVKVL